MRFVADGKLTGLGQAGVVILTTWALALIVPDLARVVVPFATLGFVADDSGAVTAVNGPPATSAKITLDDRVDLSRTNCLHGIDTPACRAATTLFGGMGGYQYVMPSHGPVDIAFCRPAPDGTSCAPLARPPLRAQPLQLPLVTRALLLADEVLGVFFVLVAAMIFWQSPSAMTFGFFLYGLWFNPGQYYVAYALLQDHPYAVFTQEAAQALAEAAGYGGFILFALRFPRDNVSESGRRIQRWLPAIVLALFVLQLYTFLTPFGRETDVATQASFVAGLLVDVLVFIVLRRRLAHQAADDTQRVLWVFWALLLGLVPEIISEVVAINGTIANQATGETLIYFLFLFNGIVPIVVYQAISRDRLVDVRFAFTRRAILAIAWITLGAALVFADQVFIEKWISARVGDSGIVLLVGGAAISLTIERIHDPLLRRLDGVLFRGLHRAERQLDALALAMLSSNSVARVDRRIVHDPIPVLRLASAAVFHAENATFVLTDHFGWDDESSVRVNADDPLLAPALQARRATRFWQPPATAVALPAGPARPALAVPVVSGDLTLAVVLYGAHVAGDDLNDEEIKLLARFAASAAVAYERAAATSLRQQNETLQAQLLQLQQGVDVKGPA